jgi:hypothetical protein
MPDYDRMLVRLLEKVAAAYEPIPDSDLDDEQPRAARMTLKEIRDADQLLHIAKKHDTVRLLNPVIFPARPKQDCDEPGCYGNLESVNEVADGSYMLELDCGHEVGPMTMQHALFWEVRHGYKSSHLIERPNDQRSTS